MTDIENEVLTAVKTALTGNSTVQAVGENHDNTFPLTTMQEIENSVYTASQDSDNIENHSAWACQFDTYTNIKSGKKAQCKAIMQTIDTTMAGLGFTRFALETIDNVQDMTICRMVSRYKGIVGTDKNIFRR